MITKSGKHHFTGTLIQLDKNGNEIGRHEDFKFTAKDPQQYIEHLAQRFTCTPWKASRIENLIDLDQ